MGYGGFKETKKLVRDAAMNSPDRCRKLVIDIYGRDTALKLMDEYRASGKIKPKSWIQAIFQQSIKSS